MIPKSGPASGVEIKVPPKYIVTFMFRNEVTLELPFADDEAVNTVMSQMSKIPFISSGAYLVNIHSMEPVTSVINLSDLLCVTPALYKAE